MFRDHSIQEPASSPGTTQLKFYKLYVIQVVTIGSVPTPPHPPTLYPPPKREKMKEIEEEKRR